jgi:hypothetical protein
MPTHRPRHRRAGKLLRVLLSLFGSDPIDTLGALWRLGRRIMASKTHEGMYEVLEYASRLELQDTKGKRAVFYKRQRVRFLQDNIIAFQDKAWGDGEIFADYKCSPGVAVDRYREGHRVEQALHEPVGLRRFPRGRARRFDRVHPRLVQLQRRPRGRLHLRQQGATLPRQQHAECDPLTWREFPKRGLTTPNIIWYPGIGFLVAAYRSTISRRLPRAHDAGTGSR